MRCLVTSTMALNCPKMLLMSPLQMQSERGDTQTDIERTTMESDCQKTYLASELVSVSIVIFFSIVLRFVLYFVMYTLTSICFTISRPNRTFYVGQAYTNFVTQLNSFLTLFFICFVSIIDSTESLDWNQKVIDPRKSHLVFNKENTLFRVTAKESKRTCSARNGVQIVQIDSGVLKMARHFFQCRRIQVANDGLSEVT